MSSLKTVRAGVIPYTQVNGSIYFLLGVDRRFHQLTDFGGGVRNEESSLEGAIREFMEETNGIFDDTVYHNNRSIMLTDKHDMAIYFFLIDSKWFLTATNLFIEKVQTAKEKCNKEISNFLWIHENRFFKILHYNSEPIQMWDKVRDFLINYMRPRTMKKLKKL